jgi:hypothetical protein
MLHKTEDPAIRAKHIADRLEKDHEMDLTRKDRFPYEDWPKFWLESYKTVLQELIYVS